MKRIYLILFVFIAACVGCDSDIDIFQEEEPTPVIYCLLDQDQPIQSLRLSRSYNSYSAHIPPDSPDSILFERALDIALEQVNGDVVEKRAFFHPVDIRKDSGFFPVTEHWIYQTDMEILPEKEYKLIVHLEDKDKIIFSKCI